jgi:hypothetical protein
VLNSAASPHRSLVPVTIATGFKQAQFDDVVEVRLLEKKKKQLSSPGGPTQDFYNEGGTILNSVSLKVAPLKICLNRFRLIWQRRLILNIPGKFFSIFLVM